MTAISVSRNQRSGAGSVAGAHWRRAIFVLAWCWLAGLELLTAETTRDEKRLFTFGQKAMEDRLYELAETQFQNLLAQFPSSEFREEAAWLLGRARLSQGRWTEAVELLEGRLTATSTEWQERYVFLIAEALLKGEQSEAAFQRYQDLGARFPKSRLVLDARYGMARALLQQQKFEAAQELLRALEKEGSREVASRATLSLGMSFFLQKKYEVALELLTRLEKDEEKNAIGYQALYALGEIDLERKQINAARARFESLARSDRPEAQSVVPSAFFRLGAIDAAANDWKAAAAGYEQAFLKSDDSAFRLKCVDELMEAYLKLDKVEVLADRLRDWSQGNAKTRLGEALLLAECTLWQRAGKREQAIREFQNFLEKHPKNDRAHFQLGWVFLENKQYEPAAAEFQKTAELAQTPLLQADAWLKLGDLNLEREQFAAAAGFYLKAFQVKGIDPARTEQALYQAANCQFKAGNAAVKTGNMSEVLRLHGVHTAQFPAGKLGADFLLLAAEANRRSNDLPKVAEAYWSLVEKFPTSSHVPRAWVAAAESLYIQEKFAESIQKLDLFVEKYPKHELVPRALLVKARCLERLGQMDKAVPVFELLVQHHRLSPSAVEAQFCLGLYFEQLKNFAKAQEQFELVQKNFPTNALAHAATYFAARAAYKLGQKPEQASHLINKVLLKEYPDSRWVFHGRFLYADILTERKDFEGALQIFNDLIKNYDPVKNPGLEELILDGQGRRGQCLRQLKRYDEALAAFKIILDSSKADAATRNQSRVEIGKTYELMNDAKRALENYLAPIYEKNPKAAQPEEREFFWICKASFEAVGLLESQKDWKAAARVLKRVIDVNLPCRKEAEERLKKLKAEHADAN